MCVYSLQIRGSTLNPKREVFYPFRLKLEWFHCEVTIAPVNKNQSYYEK